MAQFPLGPSLAFDRGRAPRLPAAGAGPAFTSLSSCGRFAGDSSWRPIKAASLWVLFVGQILGFSSIFLVGRPGELVRPAYIAKKENVPMSAMIAVWLLERVLDTIAMVVLFAAAIYFEPVNPDTAQGSFGAARDARGGHVLFVFTGLLILGWCFSA